MKREPCRVCGAHGLHDSTDRCQQTQDITGEYNCPGRGPDGEDYDGYFLYLTDEEIAAYDAKIDRQIDAAIAAGDLP